MRDSAMKHHEAFILAVIREEFVSLSFDSTGNYCMRRTTGSTITDLEKSQ